MLWQAAAAEVKRLEEEKEQREQCLESVRKADIQNLIAWLRDKIHPDDTQIRYQICLRLQTLCCDKNNVCTFVNQNGIPVLVDVLRNHNHDQQGVLPRACMALYNVN